MCTAVSLKVKDHYFGRNLDLEGSFGEVVAVTPRKYPFHFRAKETISSHYAIIGMAHMDQGYPLYYEGTNEKGLSMAGLNFPGNADYKPMYPKKDNITPFEFIPWILSQCANVSEAEELLSGLNIWEEKYSEQLPLSPLHWMISDADTSIVVESVKDGLKIYQNPVGVMTNNPVFDKQLFSLNNYMHLSSAAPQNTFSANLPLDMYSRGMGALGMPGDWSSQSRFIKASFVKMNSVCDSSEEAAVGQFFHILTSVEHPRGCVAIHEDLYEITIYSCCCNTSKGIYYYRTYGNSQITAVDMHRENLEGENVLVYPLREKENICWQN